MTHFLHQADGIFLRSEQDLLDVRKTLEIGTYLVSRTPLGEYYLKPMENFKRPPKTYGTVNNRATRIMETFFSRENSTGILLSGEQGSGKTMLARELSLLGLEQKVSTLIVSEAFCGPEFNMFMQSIAPTVVIFDEFEKVYDDEDQQSLLTLLDGLFPSKKLFVLTCNDVYNIDQHMLNRPGRLFYHLKYEGLEPQFIVEYCEDMVKNKTRIEGIVHITQHFYSFNFDMLKAIVEEVNRFDIEAAEAVEMLNVSPMTNKDFDHSIVLTVNGEVVTNLLDDEFHGNPLDGDNITISRYNDDDDDEDDDEPGATKKVKKPKLESEAILKVVHGRTYFQFSSDDLRGVKDNVYTFKKGNATLKLTRKEQKKFRYIAF